MRNNSFALTLGVAACFCTLGCSSSALTEAVVLERLRAQENLPVPPAELKVLGITEGETERIVKVDFGGTPANIKFRRFDKGWSPEQFETVVGGWVDFRAGLAMQTEREQAAAIAYLKGIVSGQTTYAVACGGGFFAPSLAALTTPPNGERLGFVVDDLKPIPGNTFVEKEHYRFEIKTPPSARAPAGCNGAPARVSGETWLATAIRKKGYRGNSYQVNADGQTSVIQSSAPALAPAPADARPAVSATSGDQLTVALTAKRPCWVSATVDGRKAIERLLQAGEQETVTVRREMVLTAGDASAIALQFNGADARPLGKPGEVVTTRFNLANFKDYLQAR